MLTNYCVGCGEIIPEGRQVCPICQAKAPPRLGGKFAYICSPYSGNVQRNKKYARQLVRYAVVHGYVPICPHLYLTEVLDDNVPEERERGLWLGLELLGRCELVIVGTKYGISEGMSRELDQAERQQKLFINVHDIK